MEKRLFETGHSKVILMHMSKSVSYNGHSNLFFVICPYRLDSELLDSFLISMRPKWTNMQNKKFPQTHFCECGNCSRFITYCSNLKATFMEAFLISNHSIHYILYVPCSLYFLFFIPYSLYFLHRRLRNATSRINTAFFVT